MPIVGTFIVSATYKPVNLFHSMTDFISCIDI